MAMEYVEGRTLEAEVESEGPLSEGRVRGLLGALTEGLSAVHAEGILHRDITPRNVMIRDDGTPVLIDFGSARQATGDRTGDVHQFLTPGFAALEQYVTRPRRGSSAALKLRQGPWTDIYALGAVTYWAMSRREHRKTLDEALARQVADELPRLAEAAGRGVSESLSVAVSSALAVHAADRPQSLEEWRELLEGPAVPVRRPARVGVVDARQATEPSPSRKAEPPPPPWRDWRLGAASTGLAAVVLLVALFAFRNGGVSGPEGPTVEVADLEARLGRPVSALASDDNGWTDLHYAAALNLPGLAERLVGEQAPVDAQAYADREPFTDDLQVRLQALGVTMDFDDFTRRGQTPLQVAAYAGAFDVVMTLLGQGADVHMRDSIGHTSLHQAAYGNAEEIVVALLEHGANVDARNDAGRTPLHGAAYLNAVGALVELLERGADIHATDDRGNTPLFRAYLFSGWTAREAIGELARRLLAEAQDGDVDLDDEHELTALHLAAMANDWEVMLDLLERGADLGAEARFYGTPPASAAESNARDVVLNLLERGVDVDAKVGAYGGTMLHGAARGNALETAVALLERGANLDARTDEGNTPLHSAASVNAPEVLVVFLERGADTNAENNRGCTPLHFAALPWKPLGSPVRETITTLLEGGADLRARCDDGDTPLHVAGRAEVLELLGAGADVSARNNDGETPLHRAAWANHEALGILLDGGASVDARDNAGDTSLHFAVSSNASESAEVLLSRGADVDARNNDGATALYEAARGDRHEVLEVLLDGGASVDARNNTGDTPLHFAASRNARESAEALLSRGADVDATDSDDATPLHRAALASAHEVLEALLDGGANVDARNDIGDTPLHFAAWANARECAEALLNRGANVNAPGPGGRRPLAMVGGGVGAEGGDDAMRVLLLRHGAR